MLISPLRFSLGHVQAFATSCCRFTDRTRSAFNVTSCSDPKKLRQRYRSRSPVRINQALQNICRTDAITTTNGPPLEFRQIHKVMSMQPRFACANALSEMLTRISRTPRQVLQLLSKFNVTFLLSVFCKDLFLSHSLSSDLQTLCVNTSLNSIFESQ